MRDHDGDPRSPRTVTGNSTLGFSRVRPHQPRHHRSDSEQPAKRREADVGRDPTGFEPDPGSDRTTERWKAIAFVLFVLVTLAFVAETAVQIAAGIDLLALGRNETGFLRRADSALTTVATQARYLTLVAGGFASTVACAVGFVVAIRSRA